MRRKAANPPIPVDFFAIAAGAKTIKSFSGPGCIAIAEGHAVNHLLLARQALATVPFIGFLKFF
jgi:hypothetical protein